MRRTTLYEKFTEAVSCGYARGVQDCIDRGVDIHKYDDKALKLAARDGHTAIVKTLIANGANPDNALALRWAARDNRGDTVALLLENGANYKHLPQKDQEKYRSHIESQRRKIRHNRHQALRNFINNRK